MNTKSDIGPCPCRYHDDNLKEQFELKGESYREEYERDFLAFLEGLINDLERRLKRGKERLDVRPNDPSVTNVHATNDETEEKRILLDLQVKELLAKIEACGEEGRIREAQELTIQADALKAELDQLKGSVDYENPLHKLDKRMEVCTVCCAFLVMNDAPRRIGAHFDGRQHSGWVKLRETVESLRQKWSSYQRRSSQRNERSDREYHRDRDYRSDKDRRDHKRDSRDSRDRDIIERERERDRDTRDYRDSRERDRDIRDSRDSRDSRDRDYRDSRNRDLDREYRESRDRDYKESRDSYSRDSQRYKRRNSNDSEPHHSTSSSSKRPNTHDEIDYNYVPGAGLDYELGEIVEDGEIPEKSGKKY